MKKKPNWFTLLDLFTIAGPGVAILGLDVYGLSVGFTGKHVVQGVILMTLVGLGFIGAWIRVLLGRKKELSEYKWYPTYGLMVHDDNGGYHLPGTVLLEALVFRTIQAWAPYHKADVLMKGNQVIWVYFKKDLNENDKNLAHRKVAGITIGYSSVMEIDYNSADQPIEATALRHELGHLIMGWDTGLWNEEVHHAFMKAHGLS